MIELITKQQDIKLYHAKFIKQLNSVFKKKIDCQVGYPGGNFVKTVKYSPLLNLWMLTFEADNKYWNGFGSGKPAEDGMNPITVEINFPLSGISRKISCAFAIENKKKILILHRGRIGGSKRGVGKNLFHNHFRGEYVHVIEDGEETEFAVVAELNSGFFIHQLVDFINEIRRIKNMENDLFTPDFSDLNKYKFNEQPDKPGKLRFVKSLGTDRNHSLVVNALSEKLQELGFQVANDGYRDLFIFKNNKIITLFEVKSSNTTQQLSSAIGQLIFFSMALKNPLKKILVLPAKLNPDVEQQLHQLGISVLYYEWEKFHVQFNELEQILNA